MQKIERALSALGALVRILDSHRIGAILLIIMQIVVMVSVIFWKK